MCAGRQGVVKSVSAQGEVGGRSGGGLEALTRSWLYSFSKRCRRRAGSFAKSLRELADDSGVRARRRDHWRERDGVLAGVSTCLCLAPLVILGHLLSSLAIVVMSPPTRQGGGQSGNQSSRWGSHKIHGVVGCIAGASLGRAVRGVAVLGAGRPRQSGWSLHEMSCSRCREIV